MKESLEPNTRDQRFFDAILSELKSIRKLLEPEQVKPEFEPCPNCGETEFKNRQARSGHIRWCKKE